MSSAVISVKRSHDEPYATSHTIWRIIYIVILVLAIVSRFVVLGERAVSHDETTHAKFSWNLYSGRGFRHDPLMHGPLLFEATAFIYALFGVSDFTARIYTALMGVGLVMTPLLFRKWLGRYGALIASLMLLISPSISYYSRYTRHDVPLLLFVMLLLWTVLRYLDEGEKRWLHWMAVFFPLMYASKENAYIYTAIFIGLFALPFLAYVLRAKWEQPRLFAVFVLMIVLAVLLGGIFVVSLRGNQIEEQQLEGSSNATLADFATPWWGRIAVALAFLIVLGSVIVLTYGVGETVVRKLRLFDVLMVLGTLTLPLGSAFLIKFVAGVDMNVFYTALMASDFSSLPLWTSLGALLVVVLTLLVAVLLGLWWSLERWPVIALIHYGVFIVTFSTMFTWGWGTLTGLVGGLAYWMAQQGVERGSQPWYYYGLIGPLYDYLPLLFAGVAGVVSVARLFGGRRTSQVQPLSEGEGDAVIKAPPRLLDTPAYIDQLFPIFLFLWALLSWVAYAIAGEKMPWLFVHIALPHILLAAWGLGRWLKGLTWQDLIARQGWVLLISLPLLWQALRTFQKSWGALRQVMQTAETEGGLTLARLEPFGGVAGALIGILMCGAVLFWVSNRIDLKRILQVFLLTLVIALLMLTTRTMVMLNYQNAELATEFMIYAHGTPDIKEVLAQVDAISWRTTGTAHDVRVAYGKEVAWPFFWYMDTLYSNNYYFDENVDPDALLACPVIIAGRPEWDIVDEILGSDYQSFTYKHVWWPIEDYKGLTWERISGALTDPAMRAALWDIIKDRDYARYAQLKNPEAPFSLQNWPHRSEFHLYVRRDLVGRVWEYPLAGEGGQSMSGAQDTQLPDAYGAGEMPLDFVTSATLSGAVGRGLTSALDGTLYIADTGQHRIWHITPQGAVLRSWGKYGVAPGQFNEPWDVTVDAEGNLYVADTWNHRIQKFDSRGTYLTGWGRLGEVKAYDPTGQGVFYGPRGIAVGPNGDVYVTDTGNKRVQVFDADGAYLREFGGAGSGPGQMNEPVGIVVAPSGEVFVADTWNQRVQVFTEGGTFIRQWDVPAWASDNLEMKPFVALSETSLVPDTAGDVSILVSDPVGGRVLIFANDGTFAWALRDEQALTFPLGLTTVGDILYVSDATNSQVLGYRLPVGE